MFLIALCAFGISTFYLTMCLICSRWIEALLNLCAVATALYALIGATIWL